MPVSWAWLTCLVQFLPVWITKPSTYSYMCCLSHTGSPFIIFKAICPQHSHWFTMQDSVWSDKRFNSKDTPAILTFNPITNNKYFFPLSVLCVFFLFQMNPPLNLILIRFFIQLVLTYTWRTLWWCLGKRIGRQPWPYVRTTRRTFPRNLPSQRPPVTR